MSYILEHTSFLGSTVGWVTIFSGVVLLGVLVYCLIKQHTIKEKQKSLENAVANKYTDEAMKQSCVPATETPEQ